MAGSVLASPFSNVLACDWPGNVTVEPALSRIGDFSAFVEAAPDDNPLWSRLLKAEGIGRPVGAKEWIAELERAHGKVFSPQRRGPKPGGTASPPRANTARFARREDPSS